jgi:hypothetical protein
MAQPNGDPKFGDVEVTIIGRHGLWSWDARVELSSGLGVGKPAIIRTAGDVDFRLGVRLRILDAAVTTVDDDGTEPAVITIGALSETYALI